MIHQLCVTLVLKYAYLVLVLAQERELENGGSKRFSQLGLFVCITHVN